MKADFYNREIETLSACKSNKPMYVIIMLSFLFSAFFGYKFTTIEPSHFDCGGCWFPIDGIEHGETCGGSLKVPKYDHIEPNKGGSFKADYYAGKNHGNETEKVKPRYFDSAQ